MAQISPAPAQPEGFAYTFLKKGTYKVSWPLAWGAPIWGDEHATVSFPLIGKTLDLGLRSRGMDVEAAPRHIAAEDFRASTYPGSGSRLPLNAYGVLGPNDRRGLALDDD
jgi:hypothetical protein